MTRPTRAEISTDAICHNFREIQRVLQATQKTPQICAMIKADAYGHDSSIVGPILQSEGVSRWGVHSLEEAARLREQKLRGDIYILGGSYANEVNDLSEYNCTPAVHSLENFAALSEKANSLPFHLKLDTGMGRLGLQKKDVAKWVKEYAQQKSMQCTGVFAHLPLSEDEGYTRQQAKEFDRLVAQIREAGIDPGIRHHSNSTAALCYADLQYDMIRPGLILYGVYPNDLVREVVNLKPVMRLITEVISVRDIPANTGLSYGHTFRTKRDSKIATLPLGYADGYPRVCGNRAQVMIRGKRCPVVGRVCMDLCLVDITDMPEVQVGDEVECFGAGIPVEEIADIADTISYEILVRVSPRVPRIKKDS